MIGALHLYLKQQQALYGNELYLSNEPAPLAEPKPEKKGLLANGKLTHSYPHSWRSKAPLVHRATPQWFISMESHKLRDKALSLSL